MDERGLEEEEEPMAEGVPPAANSLEALYSDCRGGAGGWGVQDEVHDALPE